MSLFQVLVKSGTIDRAVLGEPLCVAGWPDFKVIIGFLFSPSISDTARCNVLPGVLMRPCDPIQGDSYHVPARLFKKPAVGSVHEPGPNTANGVAGLRRDLYPFLFGNFFQPLLGNQTNIRVGVFQGDIGQHGFGIELGHGFHAYLFDRHAGPFQATLEKH